MTWPPRKTMIPLSPMGTYTIAPFMRGPKGLFLLSPNETGTEVFVKVGLATAGLVSNTSIPSKTTIDKYQNKQLCVIIIRTLELA